MLCRSITAGLCAAHQLLKQIRVDAGPPVHCLYPSAFDAPSVRDAWTTRADNRWTRASQAQKLAKRQLAKQTFDYWWNANAAIVLSELCMWAGLKADPPVSKYELMLVSIMASRSGPVSEADMYRTLTDWAGSGKYSGPSDRG